MTLDPSGDLPSRASLLWPQPSCCGCCYKARSHAAALPAHPTHPVLRPNGNVPLHTPFYSPGIICCCRDQFQIFQSHLTFQGCASQNEVWESPELESPEGSFLLKGCLSPTSNLLNSTQNLHLEQAL